MIERVLWVFYIKIRMVWVSVLVVSGLRRYGRVIVRATRRERVIRILIGSGS